MFDVSWYNDIPVSKACGSVKKHVYTQIWSNLPTSVSFNIMEGMTYYIYIYILWYIIMIYNVQFLRNQIILNVDIIYSVVHLDVENERQASW
jgi:hypothetical protein